MKKLVFLLPVILLAAGILFASEVTIGTGNQSARYPVDMYYQNSLYECIYLSTELNTGACQITAISFYNNFTTAVGEKPTKIWIGNTTLSNLSSGWVASTALTSVFDGNVNYPIGANTITITFSAPFQYTGGNLVMMVNRPMDTAYYTSSENFYCQTIGTNRARRVRSDTTNYNPASPPSQSTLTGQFPKTTFTYSTEPVGNLQGTVYGTGGVPLTNALVSVSGSTGTYTTGATGAYNFAYLPVGSKDVSVSCHGYENQTQSTLITESVTTTLDFNMVSLPQIALTGRIVGSDAPSAGISGASISLTGYSPYSATTDSDGYFSIPGVYVNNTYSYTASAAGYVAAMGSAIIGSSDTNLGAIVLNEITQPPVNAIAVESADFGSVDLSWSPAGSFGGEWIHYDTGTNSSSIGTNGNVDFTVAVRYPPSALAAYAGTSLYAVKVWPASAGTFSVRVWTGGTSTEPGTMVVDQAFTPTLASYNTVNLTTPVLITGAEELWFGMRCVVTTGYPAGCDAGPATDGFGNMIYFNNAWSTLIALAPTLDYNWNIQGFVGYSAPAKDRSLEGYQIWRLAAGDESNTAAWSQLSTIPVPETAFTDTDWGTAALGDYRWAVRTAYTNNVLSSPIFSNTITRTAHTDIAAVLLGGNENPVAGIPVIYNLEVKNSGNTVLLGSTYVVRLMNGTEEIDSEQGVDLAPGETRGFPLQWIPMDFGPVVLTGVVDMAGDSVPTNNETEGFEVTVRDPALPVVLSSFTALLATGNNVQLVWVSQSESGLMGYRIYRSETASQSEALQITPVLIPATNTSAEHSYELTDCETSVGSTYYYWLESVDFTQSSFHGPVSVTVEGDVPPVLPQVSSLRGAYPNPFKTGAKTTIEVSVKEGENATVSIYNVAGQMVRSFSLAEGYHNLQWNGRDTHGSNCGSGIYFYRLTTPSVNQTHKLVLTK